MLNVENLVLVEPLNVFKLSILICWDADDKFKLVTEVFKLAVVKFKFVILTSCESFVVLAADAELINEPLTTPISVNLISADAVNEFKSVVELFEDVKLFKAAIEVFTLADVFSKFVNLTKLEPLTTFNASILICWDADELFNAITEVLTLALNEFKFVIETPCESFVVLAADAELIKLPLTTPISVNLVSAEELNKFIFVIETPCESFVVLAVDAELINEPLTTPISINWVNTEELNEFKFVIETPTPEPTFAITDANDAETEPLYVSYPCTPVKSICEDAVTTLSPPINATLLSEPTLPAFQ